MLRQYCCFFAFVSVVCCAVAQSDLEKVKVAVETGNPNALEELRRIPCRDALPVFRLYAIDENRKEIVEKAIAVLRSIPNAEQQIGDDIVRRGQAGRFEDLTIHEDFDLLVKVGTPAAIRQIGQFVNSQVVLRSPSVDVSDISLNSVAALTLSKVGFGGAPTEPRTGMTKEERESWQVWWQHNESHIEKLLEDTKRVEPQQRQVPAPPVTSAATPAPSTHVPTAKPASSSPGPTVAESLAPAVKRKAPVWPWLVGIAALTVIALLVWKRRT